MQNWNWEHFVIDDNGKQVPSAAYWQRKKFESLSSDAKHVFRWLKARQKRKPKEPISLVEICKTVVPMYLRKADIVRSLMKEFVAANFAEPCASSVYHEGYRRKESWILHLILTSTYDTI